ncbi:MAG TPA: nitrilase-related carbon-nitrogen hydrolase [Candidatus Dormibacteraeota bacterium]|nr:nitrilase-related carbon-nitrogen hydrolase [Candidatus Dormibacteraeota bacterium]
MEFSYLYLLQSQTDSRPYYCRLTWIREFTSGSIPDTVRLSNENRSQDKPKVAGWCGADGKQTGGQGPNFAKIEAFAQSAAQRGVRLLVFPECCITGYWFIRNLSNADLTKLAEPAFTGESSQRLLALAQKYQITLGAGFIEADGGALYNSYLIAMPNGDARRHRKLQAFEHPLIKCGSDYTVFDLPEGFRAGVLICYDNNVNENGRINALLGAEVIIAPHQTGGCRTKNPHLMGIIERRLWENRVADPEAIRREFAGEKGRAWLMRWLPSRAHDNGNFLIFANGVGVDDDEIRTGNAMILDPYGRILAETGEPSDEMVVADLDGSLLEHATGREWIAARRPELYELLTNRTGLERDTRDLKFEE